MANSRIGRILSRAARREFASKALLEILALASPEEPPTEAWQSMTNTYCATALVEQPDIDALIGMAGPVITPAQVTTPAHTIASRTRTTLRRFCTGRLRAPGFPFSLTPNCAAP